MLSSTLERNPVPVAGFHSAVGSRLLAGPAPSEGPEPLNDHDRRLGPRPLGGPWLIDELERSGLRGRGGAWFPTHHKWAGVARHADGDAAVVVNGSEGEPLSAKDGLLLTLRPHLVVDGAMLAAETLGADDVVLYLSRQSATTMRAIEQAIKERPTADGSEPSIRIVRTAHRYIAGESSAAINRISGGPSKPRFRLTRSAEQGVNGQPTLVQNAETLAHVAMIARFGPEWYRRMGTSSCPGTSLITLSGSVHRPGVYEVDLDSRLGRVLDAAGGTLDRPAGALLGGYFGTWVAARDLRDLPLDTDRLRRKHGASFGCGVVAVLPRDGCAIVESSRILSYLAGETAGQCGPCVNGLASLSTTMERIAASRPERDDHALVLRWIDMVKGRGACHHPDGAVAQLASALAVFEDHLHAHLEGRTCRGTSVSGFPQAPSPGRGWR